MIDFMIGLQWKLPVIVAIVAVVEYVTHRYTMHRKVWGLHWSYRWHHEQHHGKGLKQQREHLDILLAPYIVAFVLFSIPGVWWIVHGHVGAGLSGIVSLGLVLTTHRVLWNGMHRCMHDIEENWTKRLPCYGMLLNHHMDHHRHVTFNFGVIFAPILDTICRTHWTRWKYKDTK